MKKVRIAGIATVYLMGGMVAYMEGQQAKEMMGVDGVDTFIVSAEPNKLESVEAEMKKICSEQGFILHSFADLRQKLNAKLDGVIGSLWGLMGLGFIMGALGMANTLTMNVLEQTRELALLRVVAMTRRQVRKTILAQAAIIGVIGLFTGTLGGMVGSYTINLSSIPLFGHAAGLCHAPVAGCVMLCHRHGNHSSGRMDSRRTRRTVESDDRAAIRIGISGRGQKRLTTHFIPPPSVLPYSELFPRSHAPAWERTSPAPNYSSHFVPLGIPIVKSAAIPYPGPFMALARFAVLAPAFMPG